MFYKVKIKNREKLDFHKRGENTLSSDIDPFSKRNEKHIP